MRKSASLPAEPLESAEPLHRQPGTPAWKQEVNERLAAHRTRRGNGQDTQDAQQESPRTASSRAAEAAARVAARYAKAPSYSQLLAGEARAVVRAAGAAAEAARNAQAAAQAVLAGLEAGQIAAGEAPAELWSEPEPTPRLMPYVSEQPAALAEPSYVSTSRWQDEPPVEAAPVAHTAPWPGAQPRWEEALPVIAAPTSASHDVWSDMRVHPVETTERELFAYKDFDSHDPVGSATIDPVQHIPANLIEFPRELVATKKSRPRLAEGPLYEEQESPQLNIFEVDPALLAPPIVLNSAAMDAPGFSYEVAPPEWASIELDHLAEYEYPEHSYAEHVYAPEALAPTGEASAMYAPTGYAAAVLSEAASPVEEPHVIRESFRSYQQSKAVEAEAVELLVATVSDRMLAGIVDAALVMLACVAASVVVIAATAHPPTGKIALIAAACGVVLFGLLYQYLFLTYAEEGTPGMRYARIALCTFEDDNPTRAQMQQRIPALMLSALPAGLGLLWAIFDKQHLSWHDRMTRTYQRKY